MTNSTDENAAGRVMTQMLETIWGKVGLGDGEWHVEKSCEQLADDYRRSGRTPEQCVQNFIHWQAAKAGATGLVLGIPGLAFGVITIPSDLVATAYTRTHSA